MSVTRDGLEAVIREQLTRCVANALTSGVPSSGMFNRAVEAIVKAASPCPSCAARCEDGIVVHEDACAELGRIRGHDCRADASGFCGHPAHGEVA